MGKFIWCDVGCSDTSIIVSNGDTFLIDASNNTSGFSYNLPANKKIKALFITHQHYDHFLGMSHLIDYGYQIEYLICSPYTRRHGDDSVELNEWNEFISLAKVFQGKGTKVYYPYRQEDNFKSPWWETSGLKFWMIGPNYGIANSETRVLHDACLVFQVETNSGRSCVFTGDASDSNLNWIANNTQNYSNDILHASHHGSINGADLDFIKKANAKTTIISTKSGVYDSIPHPTALQRYSTHTSGKVFRTDVSGQLTLEF